MRTRGVHMVFIDTSSWMVSTLIACHVTIRCQALVGIVCTVVVRIVGCVIVRGDLCHCGIISILSLSGIVLLLLIIGTPLGVLFLVTCLCIRGVFLSAHFDMGLQACMIGGASVMRRMVSMGVSSITLCCSFLTLCSAICVALALGGVRIVLILDWISLMSLRPYWVAPALAVFAANLSVSARKCWCAVEFCT
jgi:hypothetical protein